MKKRAQSLLAVFAVLSLLIILVACQSNNGAKKGSAKSKKESSKKEQKKSTEKKREKGDNKVENSTSTPANADNDGINQTAVIETAKGKIVFKFYPQAAPNTVKNFIKLANEGFYNGTKFHRVVPGFVIQGGDPLSKDNNPSNDGTGGPGYTINAEFNSKKHLTGTVAMARSQGINSAGSQFYICLAPQPSLDGKYTVFGQVIEGLDVIQKITKGDVMQKVYIQSK